LQDEAVTPNVYSRWGKRAFDVIVGTVLALLALPLILVLCLLSMMTFRAQPIFVQRRVGRDGKTFRFPKVRSLPKHAPRAADKRQLASVETPAFGRFLRSTHLDELPQLFLVPIGRMSLVGPRPEMPELLDRYPDDVVALRESVRPGCTGLWQVSDQADGQIYEALRHDEYYIHHVSLGLDARILGSTLRMFLLLNRDRTRTVAGPQLAGAGGRARPRIGVTAGAEVE
jgi:lipopolysaccharide/colanic/teichoic acid biosynthesis glycosyltransferase